MLPEGDGCGGSACRRQIFGLIRVMFRRIWQAVPKEYLAKISAANREFTFALAPPAVA